MDPFQRLQGFVRQDGVHKLEVITTDGVASAISYQGIRVRGTFGDPKGKVSELAAESG